MAVCRCTCPIQVLNGAGGRSVAIRQMAQHPGEYDVPSLMPSEDVQGLGADWKFRQDFPMLTFLFIVSVLVIAASVWRRPVLLWQRAVLVAAVITLLAVCVAWAIGYVLQSA